MPREHCRPPSPLRYLDEDRARRVILRYLARPVPHLLADATREVREFVLAWGLHPEAGGYRWHVVSGELHKYRAARRA